MKDLSNLTEDEVRALLQRRPRATNRAMRAQLVAQLGGEQQLLRRLRAVSFALDGRDDFAYGRFLRALLNGSSMKGMAALFAASEQTCYRRIRRLAVLIPAYAEPDADLAAREMAA